ncbi:hypothetical protein TELCIR_12671 [Teladorsagia circumcincta]|uniref:Uncharacterized protein n=1 Tax=Teladorsagia circumcincta TaxID=45464 RepID=A0A2G9U645_TELCI|nr:hypothetical protein TELCIR_12671 [Teladorsagia circumcincta]
MTPANFNDFSAFGGWTAPSVKQFVQADTLCGVTLNRMLGLALLSALILSCISGPLVQQELTAQQQAFQLLVTDYAVDINTSVSLTAFQCFHQYSHNVAFIRYWSVRGNGPSNMSPADFNDFSAFGGWTAPLVKQFVRADTFCGVTLNRNVYDTQMPTGVMGNEEKLNTSLVIALD